MEAEKQFHVCAGREDQLTPRPHILPGGELPQPAAVLKERRMSWRKKRVVSKVSTPSDEGNKVGKERWVYQLKPKASAAAAAAVAVEVKSIGKQRIFVVMISHKEVCLSDRTVKIWWKAGVLLPT